MEIKDTSIFYGTTAYDFSYMLQRAGPRRPGRGAPGPGAREGSPGGGWKDFGLQPWRRSPDLNLIGNIRCHQVGGRSSAETWTGVSRVPE